MSTRFPLTPEEREEIRASKPGPEALAAIARLRPQERTEDKDQPAGDATAA